MGSPGPQPRGRRRVGDDHPQGRSEARNSPAGVRSLQDASSPGSLAPSFQCHPAEDPRGQSSSRGLGSKAQGPERLTKFSQQRQPSHQLLCPKPVKARRPASTQTRARRHTPSQPQRSQSGRGTQATGPARRPETPQGEGSGGGGWQRRARVGISFPGNVA